MKNHHAKIHGESIAGFENTCPVCGETFWMRKRNEHEYCSNKCKGVALSTRRLGTDVLMSEEKLRERYIDQRMTMDAIAGEIGCVPSVVHDALDRHGIPARTRTDYDIKYKGGKESQTCPECGVVFKAWPSSTYERCSMECQGEWRSRVLVGEKSPTYTGGEVLYGRGWNETKKETVRERDDHQCQSCGMAQEQHLRQHDQKLHVHHIVKARLFDDDELRNNDNNLVTMCLTCHGEWEGIPLRPQIAENNNT
jgi:endogenous inhibitor of DNA gyrase (YacG/DUF329 family)